MTRKLGRRLSPLGLLAAVAACSGEASSIANGDDNITSVENTDVKSQAIGNCWLYGTAGWVESLHKGVEGKDIDVSEAYWNFWYWLDQILGSDLTRDLTSVGDAKAVEEGGWWGLAAEIIYRYGWMLEKDFNPDADSRASQHEAALKTINASIKNGKLKTPAARQNSQIVFDELVAAWRLSPAARKAIAEQFNSNTPITKRFAAGKLAEGSPLRAPQELSVLGSDGKATITLADVIGTMKPGTSPADGARVGSEAWSTVPFTWSSKISGKSRRRALQQNIQEALNRRLAVPIDWYVVSSVAKSGEYRGADIDPKLLPKAGGHNSVLVDYQASDVPGFGNLSVDDREARPEALEATLASATKITFFRVKNSWGTDPAWTEEELRQAGFSDPKQTVAKPNFLPKKPGYNDLFVDYLDTPFKESPSGRVGLRVAIPPPKRFPLTGPSSGCFSASLDDTIPDSVCVQSKRDKLWYVCSASQWVSVANGSDAKCTESYPLAR